MKLSIPLALALILFPLLRPATTAGAEAAATEGATLSIDQIVSEVLSNNASLKAARANWEAMKERVPQARAWADPRVGLDATVGRFVEVPPNSFTDYRYAAEQMLPVSGRNRLQGKAAEADAAATFGDLRRRELDLNARARTAYFRLADAHEQFAVNRRNSDLLKQFVEITRARYEVGAKPQSDVLAAETELGKLDENRFDIERQISEAESELNVLMNRPAQSPLGRPAPLTFSHPPEFSFEKLEAMAREHRPEVFAARKRIEAARSRVEVAKRGWIPEPSVRLEASQYNESSKVISEVVAGFSFDLPFFNRSKYSAAIRESKKLLESAEHDLAAVEVETLGLLRNHLKRVETFHHHSELFHDKIIPLAQQNVTSTRLSYETDKAGFLNLIDAQRTLADAESMYLNHVTDYLSALAELEAMVGTNPNEATAQPTVHPKGHHE